MEGSVGFLPCCLLASPGTEDRIGCFLDRAVVCEGDIHYEGLLLEDLYTQSEEVNSSTDCLCQSQKMTIQQFTWKSCLCTQLQACEMLHICGVISFSARTTSVFSFVCLYSGEIDGGNVYLRTDLPDQQKMDLFLRCHPPELGKKRFLQLEKRRNVAKVVLFKPSGNSKIVSVSISQQMDCWHLDRKENKIGRYMFHRPGFLRTRI